MDTRPAFPHASIAASLFGAALALVFGLSAGEYLRAGDLFGATRPTAVRSAPAAADDGVISFMTDAGGRIPDYVIGADVVVGQADDGLQQVAYQGAVPSMASDDWSTTAPSVGGDILALGGPTGARPDEAEPATTPSAESHALDASEVAASGFTARAEPKAPEDEPAPTGAAAAERREGLAALSAAGFPTP